MKIIEKRFRGSQICRVLSYPISYSIVRLLLDKGPMSLEKIAKIVQRAKPTVCNHLIKLRLANIVRYEKHWHETIYWIKYPKETKDFLKTCERLVERTTLRLRKDV